MPARIMININGNLPRPGKPVVGNGLRAQQLGEALRHHQAEVRYLAQHSFFPGEPAPPGVFLFTGRESFLARISEYQPDLLICIQGEGLELLPEQDFPVPVLADWIAPRLLEFSFQQLPLEQWLPRLVANARKADYHSCCTAEQRAYLYFLLQLAGVPLDTERVLILPLSAAAARFPRRTADNPEPVLVAGGVHWPWIQSRRFLRLAIEEMERAGRGRLRLFGGRYLFSTDSERYQDPEAELPASERLSIEGVQSYDRLLAAYLDSDLAINLFEENAERQLAFSFREMDYLKCGLPLLCTPFSQISRFVKEYEAGWVLPALDDDTVRATLRQILEQAAVPAAYSKAARQIIRDHFDRNVTILPLLQILERLSKAEKTPVLLESAFLWSDHARQELERQAAENRSFREQLEEHRRLVNDYRLLLETKEGDLRSLQGTLEEMRREMAGRETDLQQCLALIQEKDRLLGQQESQLHQLHEQHRRVAESTASNNGLLEEKEKNLIAAQATLQELRQQVQAVESELQKAVELLSAKDQTLGELNRAVQTFDASLREARSELAVLQEQRNEQLQAHAGLAGTLAEVRQYSAGLEKELARMIELAGGKDQLLGRLDTEVKDLTAKSEALTEETAHWRDYAGSREKAAAAAEAVIAELRQYTGNLETELRRTVELLSQKDRTLGELDAGLRSLQAEQAALCVENSTLRQASRDLEQSVLKLQATLTGNQQALKEIQRDNQRLVELLSEKDQLLGRLDQDAKTWTKKSEELTSELTRSREYAGDRERAAAAADALAGELRRYIATLEAELRRLVELLSGKDRILGEQSQALGGLQSRLDRLEEEASNWQSQRDDHVRLLAATEAARQELQTHYDKVENDLRTAVELLSEKDRLLGRQDQEITGWSRKFEDLSAETARWRDYAGGREMAAAAAEAVTADLRTYISTLENDLRRSVELLSEKDRVLGRQDQEINELNRRLTELSTETGSLRTTTGELQQRLAGAESAREEILRYQHELEEKLAGAIRLLASKDQILTLHEASLRQLGSEKDQIQTEMETYRRLAGEKDHQLVAADTLQEETRRYLQRVETDLQKAVGLLSEKDRLLGELDTRLQLSSLEQDSLRKELAQAREQFDEKERTLQQQAGTLEELRRYAASKENELTVCVQLLDDKDRILSDQDRTIGSLQATVQAFEHRAAELGEERRLLQAAKEDLQRTLQDRQHQNESLAGTISRLETEKQALDSALQQIRSRFVYRAWRFIFRR